MQNQERLESLYKPEVLLGSNGIVTDLHLSTWTPSSASSHSCVCGVVSLLSKNQQLGKLMELDASSNRKQLINPGYVNSALSIIILLCSNLVFYFSAGLKKGTLKMNKDSNVDSEKNQE